MLPPRQDDATVSAEPNEMAALDDMEQRPGIGPTHNLCLCTDRVGDDIVGGDPHFCNVAHGAAIRRLPLPGAADVTEEPRRGRLATLRMAGGDRSSCPAGRTLVATYSPKRRRHLVGSDRSRSPNGTPPSSATSAGEPSGAFDRGMRIVARRDRRRLRRRPGRLG